MQHKTAQARGAEQSSAGEKARWGASLFAIEVLRLLFPQPLRYGLYLRLELLTTNPQGYGDSLKAEQSTNTLEVVGCCALQELSAFFPAYASDKAP